jgi:hypothetical protein
MQYYDTLQEALRALADRGYTHDFSLRGDYLHCASLNQDFSPSQFKVVEVHRFEGMSSTDDNEVLFAIEGEGGIKGTLVDAYGPYSEQLSTEMAAKLQISYRP